MKNIVFLSIDNLRYDCVGYQQDKRELERHNVLRYLETPTLDRVAARSLCFTQCISASSYTTSAHGSLFTGQYPPRHGVRAFYGMPLSEGVMTIAEALRRSGYRTILYTDVTDLFVPLGLDRGFEFTRSRNDGALIQLLRSLRDDRVFLFAHFFDVHEPFLHNTNGYCHGSNDDYFRELRSLYAACQEPEPSNMSDNGIAPWNSLMRGRLRHRPVDVLLPLYTKGVTKFDRGRFSAFMDSLEQIDFLGECLTVVLSDHGEGRCSPADKQYFSHGGNLYDNVIRIPLMLSHPDIGPGLDSRLVSLVDVCPTVLSLLDMSGDLQCDGLDILTRDRDMAYAEFWISSRGLYVTDEHGHLETGSVEWPESMLYQRAIRTERLKYVAMNKGRTDECVAANCAGIPDEEYVRRLYRGVLGRFEDPEGFCHHVNTLQQGAVTRKELLLLFVKSDEFASFPMHAVYDLEDDPEEDHPLPVNPVSSRIYNYLSYMEELERGAVVAADTILGPSAGTQEKKRFAARSADSITEKEAKSLSIIWQAFEQYDIEHIGVAWTGGKDSTTVLHLIREAFGGRIPFKVINIDTSVKFPEIYSFRERIRAEWELDLRVFRNEQASEWLQNAANHAECCFQLKTVPLNQAIESLGLKALITGVRWDEQEARAEEEYFSPRGNPPHVRVQPILHFREPDIWAYIRKHAVPYCELYDKGYRSLGCAPCTALSTPGGPERGGRAQDKEEIMARLRQLGYF